MAVQTQMQVRRGTAASWTSTNPTLAAGEWGLETDTGKYKVGNGSTAWASLGYASILPSTATTKGDLLAATGAGAITRLGVGTDGQSLIADSTTATGLKWGTAGITWTLRTGQTTTGNRFNKIAYNGSNLYVAIGDGGVLYSSADGITWTSRTSGFGSNNINDVAFGNSLWVAVGSNGTITTSTDGITWTARTSNMSTNTINAVHYANSFWVAVGAGGGATNTGGITYSSNGTTWTRVSMTPTIGTVYNGVVWNGTNWVVTATNSTNNTLTASTPSGTWTASASGSGKNNGYIWWDGTRHYYTAGSGGNATQGSWWYSTSTTLASSVETDQSAESGGGKKTLYNGSIFSIGQDLFAFDVSSSAIASNVRRVANNLPTFQSSTAGGSNNAVAIFAGSAGYIISDGYRFWTSF